MEWQTGILTIAGMLLLRLAVPLAITFALGHALRRLDNRWQTEESTA